MSFSKLWRSPNFFHPIILIFLSLLLAIKLSSIVQEVEWQNPRVIGINKEPGHGTLIPFSNEQDALTFDRSKSENFILLNGEWDFQFKESPLQVKQEFYNDNEGWELIEVPGNWQLKGYGTPNFLSKRREKSSCC